MSPSSLRPSRNSSSSGREPFGTANWVKWPLVDPRHLTLKRVYGWRSIALSTALMFSKGVSRKKK